MGTIEALSSDAIKDSQLDFQKDKLQNLSENMQKWMEENADLEELENLERTDENLRWEDIQKMNAFRKQEQYSLKSLEKITEDLKESLDKMEARPSSQDAKETIQERTKAQ